ncbi:MAG: flagellar basal body P-ring protein FlgI [Gammaproteobacteria bacterium]|nr:flagellar basal body P-ring protein FlgI [Gammaproteobacteria bacterium]
MKYFLHIFILTLSLYTSAYAERVKDITSIQGVRSNPLIGYGLVVGLSGTGDSSSNFTDDSMKNMLRQLGIALPAGAKMPLKNVAAVSVSAVLPPFSKPGQKIDITASSIANSKSLRGGTLLMTPLKGADGKVYAIAQGNVVVGGLGLTAEDGSKVTINVPSVGRIPNGATVERTVPSSFTQGKYIILNLHRPDFTTANNLAETINDTMGLGTAQAMDASSIRVSSPKDLSQKVAFVSMLENMKVRTAYAPARIVINSRTGTVIISENVRLKPAVVNHGNLTVTITNDPLISQPDPFSDGETIVKPQNEININQERSEAFVFKIGVTLDEVVRAVNNVGATPGDLMAILEALKATGSLNAELIVI